jgi:hypothetical protein
MMLFTFALLGMDLFSGSGWACSDPLKEGPNSCFGLMLKNSALDNAVLFPVSWRAYSFSSHFSGFFDNIWTAMQSMVHVLSLEGWITIFHATADLNINSNVQSDALSGGFRNGNNHILLQPQQNMNSSTFLFFLIFIVVFSFFFLQTFVATVLSNIAQKSVTGRLTSEQLQWHLLKQTLSYEEPLVRDDSPSSQSVQAAAAIGRKEFDCLALLLSCLNIAVIAASSSAVSEDQRNATWCAQHTVFSLCARMLPSHASRFVCAAGSFIELVFLAARRYQLNSFFAFGRFHFETNCFES